MKITSKPQTIISRETKKQSNWDKVVSSIVRPPRFRYQEHQLGFIFLIQEASYLVLENKSSAGSTSAWSMNQKGKNYCWPSFNLCWNSELNQKKKITKLFYTCMEILHRSFRLKICCLLSQRATPWAALTSWDAEITTRRTGFLLDFANRSKFGLWRITSDPRTMLCFYGAGAWAQRVP